MTHLKQSMLMAAGVVVLYDTVASLIARFTAVPYASFAVGSYLIYVAAGYYGARRGSIGDGFMAAWAAGAADVTLGWIVSALIGPGQLEAKAMQSWQVYPLMLFVSLFAGVVGLLGAVLGAKRAQRQQRDEEQQLASEGSAMP